MTHLAHILLATVALPRPRKPQPPKPPKLSSARRPIKPPPRETSKRPRAADPDSGEGDNDGGGGSDDDSEPDALVPDPVVIKEFAISAMTLWRWDRDPNLIAAGWPPPIYIRLRKFRVRRQLEGFKAEMLRRAIAERDKPPTTAKRKETAAA
jgi:hypothetical protein